MYIETFGDNPIRQLLQTMTGLTSIKEISPVQMSLVLDELSRMYRNKPFLVHQKQVKPLRTGEQKKKIQAMLKELGYETSKYQGICSLFIGKKEPVFETEAQTVIEVLGKVLKGIRLQEA